MENQEKLFNTICRVCLNHEKPGKTMSLIDISRETSLSHYGSTLAEITKVPLQQNQYLPTNICLKCKESLEGISRFILACQNNDKKLRKLVKFSLKQDLEESMVKEVIRQYTLFSQNFAGNSRLQKSQNSELNSTTEVAAKPEGKYPNIKVEIEVPAVESSLFSDLDNDENCEGKTQSEDDVDIFIYSIKKLLSSSIEDIKTEIHLQNTKPLERQDKIQPKDVERPEQLICNVCNKVLATKKTYNNHIQRHGVCRFVCDQCGKGFPINAELVQHQIHTHGAASRYECDACSYRAVKKIQLIEHIRLHTGERPFTCEKCGLTFRRKTLYNKHAKFHGEPPIQCEDCPKKFFIRSALLAHRNSRHNREYIYSCRVCNVTYAMAKTVKKHMLDKHGIPRNLQGKVKKIYKSEDSFQNNVGESEMTYL